MPMPINNMRRNGQWLEIDEEQLMLLCSSGDQGEPDQSTAKQKHPQPKAGSHPHDVRQWLLAYSFLPDKWVNRLFSVGGIRWEGSALQLLAFPAADIDKDPLYRKARLPERKEDSAAPEVLYEDDFCLVLHKPVGMPVHESAQGQRGTLDEAAARHMLLSGDPLPVRHIHRLDDETSGPVLYSKNDFAQWKLDEAMRLKEIDRRYIAVVHGKVHPPRGTIDKPIGKDRHHKSRRRVYAGGEHAVTHYETVEAYKEASIVRVQLETGRTHQIRVHMSHLGFPLIGDSLYGGRSERLHHQALHGERLLFRHPWSGEQLNIEAPWPDWLKSLIADVRHPAKR